MSRAVVLLSGGMDSATALAVAGRDGHECYALTFRYGQRHAIEVEAAARVARAFGVMDQAVMDIDLRAFGGSTLTSDAEVPKHQSLDTVGRAIPSTYVPARNTIFLAFALAYAEVLNARNIYIGVNALDYSGYPDCRPEYVAAFQRLATLATRAGVEGTATIRISAPLMNLTKAQIVQLGLSLGVDYSLTTSCYDPASDGSACSRCEACLLRLKGFAEAGVRDPIRYRS